MKILLALDDPSDRLFLSRALISRGDEVTVAADTFVLLELGLSGRFAAALVGPCFCGEDGREVVARLHALPAEPKPVVLVWCPQAEIGWRREAMAAGADDVLDRPEPEEIGLRLAVAERRSAARESAHTARVVAEAFERAPDAMLVLSLASATVTHVNLAAAEILGQKAEALRGMPWSDLVPWTAEGEPPDPADLAREAGEGSARVVLRRGDSGLRMAACRAVPLSLGDDAGLLLRLAPVPEGASAERETPASRESVHDPLTGLSTAPAFLERLRAAVRAAGRHRHPLSLAVLDVENFRAVNDRHGHLAGDEVLGKVAEAIRRALRAEDLAGRVHGDTFALAFPFTPAAGASAALERLRAEIEGLSFLDPGDGAPFQIRLRLAVVEQTSRKADPEALLESARARARENVS